jgi:hypothetical protein
VTTIDVDTPHRPTRVHLRRAAGEPVAALVLGHGAKGHVGALDLLRATEVANADNVSVALVEQPYSVTGRRAPAPPRQLDAVWTAVIEHVQGGEHAGYRWSPAAAPWARGLRAVPQPRPARSACSDSRSPSTRPAAPRRAGWKSSTPSRCRRSWFRAPATRS